MSEIERMSSKLSIEDRFVLSDILNRIDELMERGSIVEQELSKLDRIMKK